MNILITGCGFIGHWLASKLQDEHNVRVVDQYSVLQEYRTKHLGNVDKFICGNVANTHYEDILGCDVVIYTSSTANAREATINPQSANDGIINGPVRILQTSPRGGIKHFIYLSSSMVYGDFNGVPDETHPLNPQEPYGMMKRTGEGMVRFYAEKYDIPYTIIRPSAVYGPRDEVQRVISKFISYAMNNMDLQVKGNNALDFTYIEDLVDGIISTIQNPKAYGEAFNMTRGEAVPLFTAAKEVVKYIGQGGIILDDHDPDYPVRGALDISKARDLLGYNPQTDIKTGIQQYVDWWMNDTDWHNRGNPF